MAEEFVKKSGYTIAKIHPKRAGITFESLESTHNLKELITEVDIEHHTSKTRIANE